MSNELYYRGSSSYDVAVKDKIDALERSGIRNAMAIHSGIRRMEYGIRSDIRQSTYAIVASQEMLAKTFQHGFDSVNNTLDFGFERMSSGLNNIAEEMNGLVDSISAMSDAICNKLDELHGIMNNPRLTAARELFRRAASNYEKGYYQEALEDCLQAVEKEKTDFISWYLLGQIYLYGAGKFSNVIDLQKAEEALENAAKYIDADIGISSEADNLASQIYYHLGYTKLLISNDLLVENKTDESNAKLEEAERKTREAYQISNKNFDAMYDNAKELHYLGKDNESLMLLEKIFVENKEYALKASCDKDFESLWESIENSVSKIKGNLVAEVNATANKITEKIAAMIVSDTDYLDVNSVILNQKEKLNELLDGLINKSFFYVFDLAKTELPEFEEKINKMPDILSRHKAIAEMLVKLVEEDVESYERGEYYVSHKKPFTLEDKGPGRPTNGKGLETRECKILAKYCDINELPWKKNGLFESVSWNYILNLFETRAKQEFDENVNIISLAIYKINARLEKHRKLVEEVCAQKTREREAEEKVKAEGKRRTNLLTVIFALIGSAVMYIPYADTNDSFVGKIFGALLWGVPVGAFIGACIGSIIEGMQKKD
ncbi:MAG: hypothetical protein KBT11_10605 [Treponema sp.]|nr:hypothetical protein [Candidatus Treponema equifaecale]